MATRQELFTAIGIIRQTCRLNGHFPGVVSAMKFDGAYDEEISFKDFDSQKEYTGVLCSMMNKQSLNITTVLQNVDQTFLDNGFGAIPVIADRLKVTSDAQDIENITSIALPSIQNTIAKEDLSALSNPFEIYNPQCGTEEPDPWAIIELEDNYANILHDIIDAMSYELQGKNSYTGEFHGLASIQLEKLINSRTFTANVYLSKLPNSMDKNQMESLVQYVENNYGKLPHAELGKHLDSNLPKLKIVRRWWAL